MTVYVLLHQRYAGFFNAKRRLNVSNLKFDVAEFSRQSKYSPAFNAAVIEKLPELLNGFSNDCCGNSDKCKLEPNRCKLYAEFDRGDLLWLGIKREIILANECEVKGPVTIAGLAKIGRNHLIDSALPLADDYDIIKELNNKKYRINRPLAFASKHPDIEKTIAGVEDNTLIFIYFDGLSHAPKVKAVALHNRMDKQSLLALAKFRTSSLYWADQSKNDRFDADVIHVIDGGVREVRMALPTVMSVRIEQQEPVFFDVLISTVNQSLELISYCLTVSLDGTRKEYFP